MTRFTNRHLYKIYGHLKSRIIYPRFYSTTKTLEITSKAAAQLQRIKQRESNPNLQLRVTVESGGCHGFQYKLSLDETSSQDDFIFERDGSKVVVDQISLDFLDGSKIDYSTELIGSEFKVIENPSAVSSCGCGTSFDYNFEKKPKK